MNSLIYAIHQLNLLERPRQLVSTCRFVKSAGPFCKGKILSLFKGNQTKGNKVFIYIILYIYIMPLYTWYIWSLYNHLDFRNYNKLPIHVLYLHDVRSRFIAAVHTIHWRVVLCYIIIGKMMVPLGWGPSIPRVPPTRTTRGFLSGNL